MQVIEIAAADAPASGAAGYAQALLVEAPSRWLFVSGQVPLAADGSTPEGFEAQCRQAWANVTAQLRAGGMDLGDVVKISAFIADAAHGAMFRAVRAEVLGGRRVAATTVIATLFDPRWLVEIDVTAAR
jgi:enamine deaminase RidA (YjgF/YER057c/UK114 family)